MCVRERGGPVKNLSPHQHNFRIIPFIIVLEVSGALPGTTKSDSNRTPQPTASQRCNVSSKLCCPHVKQWRWASPPVYTLRRNTASITKI